MQLEHAVAMPLDHSAAAPLSLAAIPLEHAALYAAGPFGCFAAHLGGNAARTCGGDAA
jgi:hypothetical protein